MIFQDGQHIHIIGVGGFGMSAIARILLERGYQISGSDRNKSPLAAALERDGATVFVGHDASQVNGADIVLVSSAVPATNPEVVAAKAQHIPIYKRQDILAHLMAEKTVIAVAGTHGKTTTTAMIVHLLRESGQDPSYIVGGVMANTGTNAGNGLGEAFVIEADEYDNAFLGLFPDVAIVTSVEYDHPDFFKSEADLMNSFRQFLKRLSPDHGVMLACADSAGVMQLATERRQEKRLVFTYGLSQDAVLMADNIRHDTDGALSFDVIQAGKTKGRARLQIPGEHNIQNALAALYAAGPGNDQSLTDVIPHLETFRSTGRRFDVRADVDGIVVIDDYAHHPTAIRTTVEAAKKRYPDRTLWAIWQPHTYTRTRALWDDYIQAFDVADHVLVTDIYAAREEPLDGIHAEAIVAAFSHPSVTHTPTLSDAVLHLLAHVTAPAAILIMSAGDAPQIGIDFLARRGDSPA